MNTQAVLSLIGDLYAQIAAQQAEIRTLKEQAAAIRPEGEVPA